MILTSSQLNELLEIIEKNQLIVIGQELGDEFLTKDDKELLMRHGVDVGNLYSEEYDTLYTNFQLGMLAEALGHLQTSHITYEQLRQYISHGDYIPLTQRELATIHAVKNQTFTDLKKLGSNIFQDINQVLVDRTLAGQRDFIRKELEQGVLDKATITQISHTIAEKTGDWSRDFDRIIAYNSHLVFEEGKVAMIERNNEGNDEVLVYKTVFEGACERCVELYLTNGVGSEPRIFKLSELKSNGTNIGRKVKEWKPTIGPVHPYCYDDQTEVLTNDGWKYFKELTKKEKFLSIDLQTGDADWIKAIEWVAQPYKGKLFSFQNKNFNLVTTPNHHHVIRTYAKKQLRLIETQQLPKESQFLKHIPNWIGESIEYKFDNQVLDTLLFSEFLGFFLSEGSAIDYKGRKTLHIAQSQEKYLDEIFSVCKTLFNDGVSKQKDYIQIMCTSRIELWDWLRGLGKANKKRIPKSIKQLSKEFIKAFLDAYCKGDGSFIKGRVWDNYQCNDSRVFYTSSKQMADDLGELILKIGNCPSYTFKEPQIIFDSKRNKSYTQNQGIWVINETVSKYVYKNTTEQKTVDYNGIIYDVELEKFHTLIIRREGKVCVSGNCRCLLHELPKGYVWDKGNKNFIAGSKETRTIKRAPIRVTIGGIKTTI